jgi:hypothetical protein
MWIFHILLRALSGISNGFYYADKHIHCLVSVVLYFVSCLVVAGFAPHTTYGYIGGTMFVISAFMMVGKYRAFDGHETFYTSDIHLWENLVTMWIPLGLMFMGESVVLVLLTMYPGLFLHKLVINLGSNLPIFENRTDDPTGKTYGMTIPLWVPIFGGELVKVPRTTQRLRLIISIVCLVLCGLYFFLPKFSILGFNI